jgi:hypothetical protein
MELAERYSKFAIGAYGTNFLKIMGWVSHLLMRELNLTYA